LNNETLAAHNQIAWLILASRQSRHAPLAAIDASARYRTMENHSNIEHLAHSSRQFTRLQKIDLQEPVGRS
jgi:hypothetical protein